MSCRSSWMLASFALVGAGCSPGLSFESGASSGATYAASSGDTSSGSGAAPGDGDGDGGDTSSPSSTGTSGDGGGGASSTGVTSTTASTGTGGGCSTADCADGNPCTIDSCSSEGTCEVVLAEPGAVGNAGEGSCPSGTCQTDGTCGLSVYSHAFGSGMPAQWERTTLSELWGDLENAPPFSGIREIVPLPALGYFAVFAEVDGENILFVREADGTWLTPTLATTYLPGLPGDIRCGYAFQPLASSTDMTVLLSGPGQDGQLQQAYAYTVSDGGFVTPDAGNPHDVDRTDEGGNPPPNGDPCRYTFAIQTGFLGEPSWVVAWDGTGGNVYHYDGGSAVWTSYGTDTGSPLWNAQGDGPVADSVVAAWFEDGVVYLVAP